MKRGAWCCLILVMICTLTSSPTRILAQPPDDIDSNEVRAAPKAIPDSGPMLGVRAAPYYKNTPNGPISGARVTSDSKRRKLWKRNSAGQWRSYTFRTGYDVILEVNDAPVSSADDIKENTMYGWNKLRIWDTYQGSTSNFYIELN